MKKLAAIGIFFGILVVAFFSAFYQKGNTESTTLPSQLPSIAHTSELKASFVIFTNGTKRIFSDPRYLNLSEEVYIQQDNPNIVHIKKTGTTWSDFFKTLPMKLSYDCLTTGTGQTFCSTNNQQLKFYVNGELKPFALDQSIKDGDRLLVSYGSEKDEEIDNQLQQVPTIK